LKVKSLAAFEQSLQQKVDGRNKFVPAPPASHVDKFPSN